MSHNKRKSSRVFVTGCGGMLGSAIYPYFFSRYENLLLTDKDKNEPWLEQLDVRDDDHLSRVFKQYKPDIVLHLAAETDLEYCETHPGISKDTNTTATKTIAKLSKEYDSTLIYISTAGVFDGLKRDYYTEDDLAKPIMVYGQTKYDGELASLKYCSKSYVVRAGWMMGGGRKKEKKFIYKILQQIGNRENGEKEIFAVDDRWGTPTYTHDFAMNLFELLETRKYGTYHMVCEGKGTRLDVAREILSICNRSDIKLTPVSSDFFKNEYFAPRPFSEMMYNANLRKLGIHLMRSWQESLSDYIRNYFFDYIRQNSSKHRERRKHYRKECDIQVFFAIGDGIGNLIHSGILTEKSASGACLVTDVQLRVGQIIVMKDENDFRQELLGNSVENDTVHKLNNSYRVGLESIISGRLVVTNVVPVHSSYTTDYTAPVEK